MNRDLFAHKAASYEQVNTRVSNVDRIADAIAATIALRPDMHLLDFGAGTGLLLERIAPRVGRITAVDISASMIAQLETKRAQLPCQLETLQQDLTRQPLAQTFDGIISSMTLHHIESIATLLDQLYQMLEPGGFIALADLEPEDGSFHTEDTGVFHHGFDTAQLKDMATSAGFSDVAIVRASEVEKPQGCYPVFLLTACKAA